MEKTYTMKRIHGAQVLRTSLENPAFTAPISIPFGALSGTVKARLQFRHCTQLVILRLSSVMSVALARCLVLNRCANLDIEPSTSFHRAKSKYLSSVR